MLHLCLGTLANWFLLGVAYCVSLISLSVFIFSNAFTVVKYEIKPAFYADSTAGICADKKLTIVNDRQRCKTFFIVSYLFGF